MLVHSYRARSLQNGQPIWDLFHPRSLYATNTNPNCKNMPMPLMVHAYEPHNRTKPVFDLFPTSAISSGVWTQDDFRDTAAHPFKWFLYGPPPRGFFRNSGDLYVDWCVVVGWVIGWGFCWLLHAYFFHFYIHYHLFESPSASTSESPYVNRFESPMESLLNHLLWIVSLFFFSFWITLWIYPMNHF